MNPLCSVIAPVHDKGWVVVLEELIMPDSNTAAACEEFLSRTAKWFSGRPLAVSVDGDSTGEQRRTSASRTDWQIVKDSFGRYPERFYAKFRIPSVNPPVKDRINCANAPFRNYGNALMDLDKSDPDAHTRK